MHGMRRLAPILLLGALCPRVPLAQQRPSIVQSLDLLVPRPPETVRIAGKTHLVYELHFTSFLPVEAVITRLQVLSADPPGAVIADIRDADLGRTLGRPGLCGAGATPSRLGPGSRAVAYFWIALPDGASLPRALRHRVEIDGRRAFEGAEAGVSDDEPVVIGPPLRAGPWAAAYDPHLMGGHRTVFYTLDGKARIPGRFAVDWVRLTAGGTLDRRMPRAPDWNGYGAEVLAVADGLVAAAMDDIPDSVGEPGAVAHALENASGNYVALDIGRGRFALYEHLRHGSVAVKPGDRVRRGQVIAELGNSGSSSIGPHLHFHVSDAASPLRAEGVPFVFSGFEVLGAFTSIGALVGGERWVAARGDAAGERKEERPGENAVVRFP